jgi:hypothetical protein
MPRKAVKGERRLSPLSMKTTEALRSHLERSAEASGRTLTHEVEYRLERSFSEDRNFTTPTNAAILRDIGSLLSIIGFDRNALGNKTSKDILLKAFEKIVSAHLMVPQKEEGLAAHLRALASAEDPYKANPKRAEQLEKTVLALTDAVIATSALPDLGIPVISASAPFGFQPVSSLAGAIGAGPIPLNKLSEG